MPRSDDYKAAIALAVAELQQVNPRAPKTEPAPNTLSRMIMKA